MRLPTKWLALVALVLNGVAFYWLDSQQKLRLEQTHMTSAGAVRDREPGGTQLVLLSKLRPTAALKLEKVEASDESTAIAQSQVPNSERTNATGRDAEHQGSESIQFEAAFERRTATSGCWFLGPFAIAGDAAALARKLAITGVNASVRIQDKKIKPRIWVYLPPPAFPAMRAEQLKRLADNGIDHFVIADGELAGGISLGLYVTWKDAEKWQQELALRGYDAKIHDASSVNSSWVKLPSGTEKYMAEQIAVAMKGAYPGLRLETRACVQGSIPEH